MIVTIGTGKIRLELGEPVTNDFARLKKANASKTKQQNLSPRGHKKSKDIKQNETEKPKKQSTLDYRSRISLEKAKNERMNFPTTAPFPFNTYDHVPEADRKFKLTSSDMNDCEMMPEKHRSGKFGVPGGEDISPALQWSDFPEETKSFVVTCYDPDAPVVSGIWHWCMYDIPADVISLETDAGNVDIKKVPLGAKVLKNDVGMRGYLGAGAPPGHGDHRYIFCVTAVAVDHLPINEDVTPALLHSQMNRAGVLGRGFLTGLFGR